MLSGLRVDHFAEEGLETFETATDRGPFIANSIQEAARYLV